MKAAASNYKPLAELVTSRLREDIAAGVVRPGEHIGQEEIARRYGTSRIPAREALRQLEIEGLVTLIPHSGARVARLRVEELNELYVMRENLEPVALELSVPRLSDDQVIQLDRLASQAASMMESARTAEEQVLMLGVDRQFHLEACAECGMPRLLKTVESLLNAAQPYRRAYFVLLNEPRRVELNNTEHRLLIDAIQHREAKQASQLLRLHIGRTRHAFLEHSELLSAPL